MRLRLAQKDNPLAKALWKIIDDKYNGIYTYLAKDLGISRQALYRILKRCDSISEHVAQRLYMIAPELNFNRFLTSNVRVRRKLQKKLIASQEKQNI